MSGWTEYRIGVRQPDGSTAYGKTSRSRAVADSALQEPRGQESAWIESRFVTDWVRDCERTAGDPAPGASREPVDD